MWSSCLRFRQRLESKRHAQHAHGCLVDAVDFDHSRVVTRGACDIEQRVVMVGRWHGEAGGVAKRLIVDEVIEAMAKQGLADIVIEARRPFVGKVVLIAPIEAEIVNDIPGAEDQDAFVPERLQPLPTSKWNCGSRVMSMLSWSTGTSAFG